MTNTESYGAFAYAYDRALGERFFRSMRHVLAGALERHPTPRRTHLDVACGTGLALRFFREQGFRSVGVDASLPMLRQARPRGAGVAAGDFRALPFRGTFARITCLYDSLNHLKDRSELVATFRSIRRLMDAGSLFLFDMNHPEIYPEIWGMNEPYVASGPGYHLEIATKYRKRDRLGTAVVSGWAVLPNDVRVPIHEQHQQRAYSEREIVASLGDAGMVPVEVIDFDPFNEVESLDSPAVKLFFICKPA